VKRSVSRSVFLAAALASVVSFLACARVSWVGGREVCGQMRVVDKGEETVLRNSDLVVYRSKSKYTPCCSEADRIANARTNSEGSFKSGDLKPGRYFVVVENSNPKFVVSVWLEKYYDGKACALNTVFTFERTTVRSKRL
jgi:hypothetical protein